MRTMSNTTQRILLVTALFGAFTSTAGADVAAAARAFSDGQAAQLGGDYDRAAQSFELAYSIAPSGEALRSAVRARQLGNQPARAATLAELLLAQYASDPASIKLATEVIAEAKPKLGRTAIACTASCTIAVGGRAVSISAADSHVVYLRPGRQELEITFEGGASVTRELVVKPGDDVKLAVERPATAAPPPPALPSTGAPPPENAAPVRDRGLSPVVAIVGGALTLGLVGAGVWSGLDTNHAHDAYVASPTSGGWTSGRSKQLRTNLLFGGAAATGVGTALVAMFWTRWRGEHEEHATLKIAPSHGGFAVSLAGRF